MPSSKRSSKLSSKRSSMPSTVAFRASRRLLVVALLSLVGRAAVAGPAEHAAVQRLLALDGMPAQVTRQPASGAVLAIRAASIELAGGRSAPGAALRDWVNAERFAFGLSGAGDEVRLEREERLPDGRHRVQLRQYRLGLPVDGADARGIVDGDGRLRFLAAGFRAVRPPEFGALIGAAEAVAVAARVSAGSPAATGPQLWLRDAGEGDALAWRVVLIHADGREQVSWVDATSGRLLVADADAAHALGLVYPGDPSGPLAEVALERLRPGAGLQSAAFRIEDALHPAAVPAGPDDDYRFAPEHPSFDQVNAYWHTDRFLHDFLGALGYAGPPESLLVRVNMPTEPFVAQTSGRFVHLGRPIPGFALEAARAPDILYHELTHAVLYGAGVSASGTRREAVALHEGLADYFAAALTGDPGIGQWLYLRFPDGATRVDQPVEPWNYDHYDVVGYAGGEIGSQWGNGMILSSALWDLRSAIGVSADSLVLESLDYLPASPMWAQFANALLQADHDRHAGRWRADIVRTLLRRRIRGAVEAAIEGPATLEPGVVATFRARPCCGAESIGSYRWRTRSWCRGQPCSGWREQPEGSQLTTAFGEDSELQLTVLSPWSDTLMSVPHFVSLRPPVLELSGPRTLTQHTLGTWSARLAATGPARLHWTRTWRRPGSVAALIGQDRVVSFAADTACDLEVTLTDGMGRRVSRRWAVDVSRDRPPADRNARFMTRLRFDRSTSTGELTVELVEPATVSAMVYDVRGRGRVRVWDGPMSRGVRLVRWRAEGLEPGVYFLRVRAGPAGDVQRFVVLR